jgi:hypothetical protein
MKQDKQEKIIREFFRIFDEILSWIQFLGTLIGLPIFIFGGSELISLSLIIISFTAGIISIVCMGFEDWILED